MTDLERLIDAGRRGDVEAAEEILRRNPDSASQRDDSGATALHYTAFNGHRDIVRALVKAGADVNALDDEAGATPAGWAIEYLRELGALLAIELDDLAFAIRRKDADWVARFVRRLPALREAHDKSGQAFRKLAEESECHEIAALFD